MTTGLAADVRELAAGLNRRLYQKNPDVDWRLAEIVGRQVDAIASELGWDEESREEWSRHRFRLAATLRDLEAMLGEGTSVLELGGTSMASYLLRSHHPGIDWTTSDWDLRLPWPTADDSWDLMLLTEVLEHLSDPPEGFNEEFTGRGVDTCLREACRSLRPGGRLFLTTPNAASVICLMGVLEGGAGQFFRPHHREYSGAELHDALEAAGFAVESQRAVHCLTVHEPVDCTPLFEFLLEIGAPTDNRGDDWFVTASRPLPEEPSSPRKHETDRQGVE